MNLLICSATEQEVILSDLPGNKFIQTNFLVTGVGLTAATYSLSQYIFRHKPDFIIQAGIAGCFDTNLKLNDVVSVEKDTIGDLGVVEAGSFKSVFQLGLQDKDLSPWKDQQLINTNSIIKTCGLKTVNSVTVNEITTDEKRIQYYRQELNAQLESMEGAALHYVCILENIPFLQIRAISNYVGERNKEKWDFKNSITRLNEELLRIIKTLEP